ncbi:hypothetical protein TNCV_3662461 [Trichonephila clavipes]|nr:hypothetical protein TNCV_3662461 [Trichonephila clavipes]
MSICEALAKRNEIDPFLKRMVTGDEKWVSYYNIVRKGSWLKCGEAAQTAAKPGLTARKVYSSKHVYGMGFHESTFKFSSKRELKKFEVHCSKE